MVSGFCCVIHPDRVPFIILRFGIQCPDRIINILEEKAFGRGVFGVWKVISDGWWGKNESELVKNVHV
jgi:hypothetical protein